MVTKRSLDLSLEESASLCKRIHLQTNVERKAGFYARQYTLSIDSTGKGYLILHTSLLGLKVPESFADAVLGRSEKLPLEAILRIFLHTPCWTLLRLMDMKDFGVDVTKNDNYTLEYDMFLNVTSLWTNDAQITVQVDFQTELHAPVDFEIIPDTTKVCNRNIVFDVISSTPPTKETIDEKWPVVLANVKWPDIITSELLRAKEKYDIEYTCTFSCSYPLVRLDKLLPCEVEIHDYIDLNGINKVGQYHIVASFQHIKKKTTSNE